MRTLVTFFTEVYTTVVGAFIGHLTAVLAIVGATALVVAAYHYGRHIQSAADKAALGESYRTGWGDAATALAENDAARRVLAKPITAIVNGVTFPRVPVDWRTVPATFEADDEQHVPASLGFFDR